MDFRLSIEEGFKVDAANLDYDRQKDLGISDLGNEDKGSVIGIAPSGRESRLGARSNEPNNNKMIVDRNLKNIGEIQQMYTHLFLDDMKRELGMT